MDTTEFGAVPGHRIRISISESLDPNPDPVPHFLKSLDTDPDPHFDQDPKGEGPHNMLGVTYILFFI